MRLSKIAIGGMRFRDRQTAIATLRKAIDCGFNYVDTSPCYLRQSEDENSERWVGEALNHADYRQRVMVGTKSTPGNGGLGLGELNLADGFGVRTAENFNRVLNQSLNRLGMNHLDYYHLWTTHTQEQFQEAFRTGGWYDGLTARKESWDHLGITTHADSKTIISFLKQRRFETVTLPLNVINTTRLEAVNYCRDNGIVVFAMNPLAGGFLAAHERLKELALRYLMALEGVHVLIGFATPADVEYAKWIEDTTPSFARPAEEILREVNGIINSREPRCTACGYCLPCPQSINVGACLSYYNVYKYLGMNEARQAFLDKQWEDGLRLDKCTACGLCASRCPNGLDVVRLIKDAKSLLYGKG
jgi:predicted aldo/keto reductase-like oxidoreductase